ncbi:MAG: hypothetical protein A2104_09655 [Candidatus Melainabacteria bacterium GWF2_32_7]|nr:MAG: hypothetical protein A2104_09655 [Candidatus Melainabacteria bacterium GWF2_32_7]
MRITNSIAALVITIFLFNSMSALAEAKNGIDIRWECLNLTPRQEQKFAEFDKDWERIYSIVRPKLIRDQERLKLILTNPDVSDIQIKELQKQIFIKQEQLRYYALENFLSKRHLLTPKQRIILHEIFCDNFKIEQ